MFDQLKKLFVATDPTTPQEDVEAFTGAVAELTQALADAEAKAAALRQAHSDGLLEQLAAGGAAQAAKARKEIAAADAEVADLRGALANASDLLARATEAAQARALAERWARVEALLQRREAAVVKVQATLDTLADDFRDMLKLTRQITDSLPVWPSDSRAPVSQDRLANDAMVYLHGQSGGLLGAQRLAISTPMIKQLPSLIELAGRHTRMLMAASHSHSPQPEEAA